GEETTHPFTGRCGCLNVFLQIGVIVDKPLHAAFEAGETVDNVFFESLHCKKGNQPNKGAHLEVVVLAVRKMKNVIVKAILVVPEFNTLAAAVVHGVGDVNKVFQELAGDVFIGGILAGQLKSNCEHVQA